MLTMTQAVEHGKYYMTLERDENGTIIEFHNLALVGAVIAKLSESAKPANKALAARINDRVTHYFKTSHVSTY